MEEQQARTIVFAPSPWIVGTVLVLLIGLGIRQAIVDHQREVAKASRKDAEVLQKQQASEQAERKARATKFTLDSDEKELSRICEGRWNDACVQPLAEHGNAAAQFLLGSHLSGKGNYDAAIPWLENAANQGDTNAMNMLGLLYSGHSFQHVDGQKALRWYHQAADLGNGSAMHELGEIYLKGELISQDYVEARRWFLKAAEGGGKSSLSSLGSMAEDGDGAQPDLVEAYKWFAIGCAAYGETLGRDSFDCSKRDQIANQLSPAGILNAQALASAWEKQFRK